MPRILVVEDSAEQALLITSLLEAHGFDTDTARNGRTALEAIASNTPDVVLTDMIMPELNGLALVEVVRREYPSLPVILMTAYGNGEIAARALQSGAASYVPKRCLREQLVETVESTHALARARRETARMMRQLSESESRYVLENDPSLVSALVGHLQETIAARCGPVHENQMMQVGMAIQEALLNAIQHGNLEVDSAIRETSGTAFQEQIERRRFESPYRERRVHFNARLVGDELTCVVRDEGKGFDVPAVPDPTDEENLLRSSGRGLYLMNTFMDRVEFNELGNCVTMVKKLQQGSAEGDEADE